MLKEALEPWKDLFNDIPLTFTPYRQNNLGFEVNSLTDITYHESAVYRAENIWGDVVQPLRGVGNAAKGVWSILKGLAMVLPPVFIGVCLSKRYDNVMRYSGWLAVKETGEELLQDLVRGTGLLLRGVLQVATTPLTWLIRMPLRGLITYYSDGPSYVVDEKSEFDSESDKLKSLYNPVDDSEAPVGHNPYTPPIVKLTMLPGDEESDDEEHSTEFRPEGYVTGLGGGSEEF